MLLEATASHVRICSVALSEIMCRVAVHGLPSHLPLVLQHHQTRDHNHDKEVENCVANDCPSHACPCQSDTGIDETKRYTEGSSNTVTFHKRRWNAFALEHHVANETQRPSCEHEDESEYADDLMRMSELWRL